MDTAVVSARAVNRAAGAASLQRGGRSSVWLLEAVWYIAVLAAIAAAGFINLYRPLFGDSALFLLAAEGMSHGNVLYVDFWDNKQPGIFAFFYVAGRLFGFTGAKMHLFELCWMLAFTVVLCVALRPLLRWRWLSGLAPLVMMTVYYFHAEPRHLLQVEGLVGFPTFVSAWLLAQTWEKPVGRIAGYVLGGVAAAVAVAFKLVFAILFIAFVLLATVEQVRRCRPASPIAFVAGLWTAFTVGVGLVLGAIVAVFAAHGALSQLLWTAFIYPGLVAAEIGKGLIEAAPGSRLVGSLAWFIASFAPWLPFAAVGMAYCIRQGEHALFRLMPAWLIIGLVIILLQRFSWWPAHMNLLFTPLAVMAVRGIDMVAGWLSDLGLSARRATAAVALFLVTPSMAAVAAPAGSRIQKLLPVHTGGGDKAERIARYQLEESETYRRLIPVAEVIGARDSLPGDIYVFGDPLIYLFSGRHQALPVHGWSWQMFVEPLFQRLPDDLLTYRPVYIFLIPYFRDLFEKRNPRVLETIETHYTVEEVTSEGTWYRLARPES